MDIGQIDWGALSQIITFLIAIAGLVLSLYRARPEVRKVEADTNLSRAETEKARADAAKTAAESVDLLIPPLNHRIDALTEELAKTNKRGEDLVQEIMAEREARKAEREAREAVDANAREEIARRHAAELSALNQRVSEQQAEIEALKLESSELKHGVAILVIQLKQNNITPRWPAETGPSLAGPAPLDAGAAG